MLKEKYIQILTKLKTSSIFKGVVVLVSGSVIAQVIPILISPILTRLYSPEDFGLLALFTSIAALLGVISNGRYSLTILLPKKNEAAVNLLFLSLIVSCVTLVVYLLGFYTFKDYLNRIINNSDIESWFWVLALMATFLGFNNAITFWFNRHSEYKLISIGKVIQTVSNSIISLIIGVFALGSNGLIIGSVIGQAAYLSYLTSRLGIFKDTFSKYFSLSRPDKKEQLLNSAIEYKNYPIYNAAGALADSVALQLPILLFTYYYSTEIVGHFSLTQRITQLPAIFLAFTASQILFDQFARKKREGLDLRPFLRKSLIILVLLPIPLVLFLMFFGPAFFSYTFGEEWRIAGEYAQILILVSWIKFVVSPFSILFAVQEKIELGSKWQYLYLVTTVATLFISLANELAFSEILMIYCVHELILYMIYFFLIYKITRKD